MRQHEAIMQNCAPAHRAPFDRCFPSPGDQSPQEQLLRKVHAGVRRHLKTAKFHEAETPRRPVRRVKLVDADLGAMGVPGDVGQHVAQQPVDQPRRRRWSILGFRDLRERDLQFVKRVVPRLVDPRGLTGRSDEKARKEVGQRRVPLPKQDQRLQHIRAAQKRAVVWRGATDYHVVSAACTGVAPVYHELVRPKAALARLFIDGFGGSHAIVPTGSGVDVDFQHAGVGCDAYHVEARIIRWRISFDVDGQTHVLCGGFSGCKQIEIIFGVFHGRHKDTQTPVAWLDRDRRADRAADRIKRLFDHTLRGAGRLQFGHRLTVPRAGFGQRVARFGVVVGQGAAFDSRVGDIGVWKL